MRRQGGERLFCPPWFRSSDCHPEGERTFQQRQSGLSSLCLQQGLPTVLAAPLFPQRLQETPRLAPSHSWFSLRDSCGPSGV